MTKNPQKTRKSNKSNNQKLTIRQMHREMSELDSGYIQIRQAICNTKLYRTTNRHLRIRLDLWSRKLDQIVSEIAWKKNRNVYIKLMYLMTQSEVIVEPFLTLPPQGEMAYLRNYEINTIIDLVESQINEKISKYGSCQYCQFSQEKCRFPTFSSDQSLSESPGSQDLQQSMPEKKSGNVSYRSITNKFFQQKGRNKQNQTLQNYETQYSNFSRQQVDKANGEKENISANKMKEKANFCKIVVI